MNDIHRARRIQYWIFEIEMSDKTQQEINDVCIRYKLTLDELFEAAFLNGIREAKADPEGFKQKCRECDQDSAADVRLVRCYPVFQGETDAQAYRRKLAEESAEKGGK